MSRLPLISIALSATLYTASYYLNEWLFPALQLHAGAHWIFLPAGFRLLCTLLFGGQAAIGLLLASLLTAVLHLGASMDMMTALVTACISAGAPYLVYRLAPYFGMPASLKNLTPGRLSMLAVAYAFANAGLHSLWFAWRGHFTDFAHGFTAMFVGDLLGTLLVLYAVKILLAAFRKIAQPA